MSKKNDYEEFNSTNEALLKEAIDKTFANNHEVYFNVYNGCDRFDGTPWVEKANTHEDVYECDVYEEDGKECCDIIFVCPMFDKGGCADLIIKADNKVHYVLYQDRLEERVYTDDIKNYLQLTSNT